MTISTLKLSQIKILCSIGFHEAEKKAKQPILIDIEIRLNSEPKTDNVAETLDYDEVFATVQKIAAARHYNLQETLARHLYDAISKMKNVKGVEVKIQKPNIYPNCKTVSYRLSNLD